MNLIDLEGAKVTVVNKVITGANEEAIRINFDNGMYIQINTEIVKEGSIEIYNLDPDEI